MSNFQHNVAREPSRFGALLARCRKAAGMSQSALARAASVSTRHLSFLESGRSNPSRSMIDKLARALQADQPTRQSLFQTAGLLPWPQHGAGEADVDVRLVFELALAVEAQPSAEAALKAARNGFDRLGLCGRNCVEDALRPEEPREDVNALSPELALAVRVLRTTLASSLSRFEAKVAS